MKRIDINNIKRKMLGKKVIIGTTIISSVVIINIGVVFADGDANALLNSWFNKKASIAKTEIQKTVKSETEIQKQRITDELKKKMEASSKDLDRFTENEKAKRRQAIIEYATSIINNTNFSKEADKKQVQEKLDAIVENAKKAMDDIKQNSSQAVSDNSNAQQKAK